MSWLDELAYPYHVPEALQLHRDLVKLKPSSKMAMYVAVTAGLDPAYINSEQAPFIVWKEILDQASAYGKLRVLLKIVKNELSPDHSLRLFIENILQGQPVPLNPEPVNADGTAKFIEGNDTIGEQEALLFHDDLTLPIGKLPALIKTMQLLVALSPAVCRIAVDINGVGQAGTGFRVGKRTVLTNHHVLHSKNTGAQATAVSVQFGYEDDGSGGIAAAGNFIKCDISSIRANKENDWGIIATSQDLPETIPTIDLTKSVLPQQSTQTFIIQHPLNGTKRIGYVRNTVTNFSDRVVHYLTDTQEGSSGAPVFNEEGMLIAVHRVGGVPTDTLGKAPMKKNEGILAERILKDFSEQNITIV